MASLVGGGSPEGALLGLVPVDEVVRTRVTVCWQGCKGWGSPTHSTCLPHQQEFVDIAHSGTSVCSTAHFLDQCEVCSARRERIMSQD